MLEMCLKLNYVKKTLHTLYAFQIKTNANGIWLVCCSRFSLIIFENLNLHNKHVNYRCRLHFVGRNTLDKLYNVIERLRHLSLSVFVTANVISPYVAVVNLCKRSDSLRQPIRSSTISCSGTQESSKLMSRQFTCYRYAACATKHKLAGHSIRRKSMKLFRYKKNHSRD